MQDIIRCSWAGEDTRMQIYHDTEWGVPVHDDVIHFEYLILDAAQAGLNWKTILHKREGYRNAFAQFHPEKVALFGDKQIERLLQDSAIIRNRQKIISAIKNAQAFLQVQKEFGTFDTYIWQFVEGKSIKNTFTEDQQIPAKTDVSEKMSKDMKKRGFQFVGPTICYAYMQAAGLVNDHISSCFRYKEVMA